MGSGFGPSAWAMPHSWRWSFTLCLLMFIVVSRATLLRGPVGVQVPEEVAGRLAPLVRDAAKRLQGSGAHGVENTELLQAFHNFFGKRPAEDRITMLVQAVKRYRGVGSTAISAMGAAAAPAAAAPASSPAMMPPPEVPVFPVFPAVFPATMPPPVVPAASPAAMAAAAATAATVATVGAIDHASERINDSVGGLNQDIDSVFGFLDQVAHWKMMTPHIQNAVMDFSHGYKDSLRALTASVVWTPEDGPNPFPPLPAAPGAAPGSLHAPGAPGPSPGPAAPMR